MSIDNRNNCLSYWFPILESAGVPVPLTTIIKADYRDLFDLHDGKRPKTMDSLVAAIGAAAKKYGVPAFLRTGQGSGKHDWDACCNLTSLDPKAIEKHVGQLIMWSSMVDFLGLPFDVWAVREWLSGPVAFVKRDWANMPVRREFRCFVDGADVKCVHPYWPLGAFDDIKQDNADALAKINVLGDDEAAVRGIASRAGSALGGAWSVDVLWTDRGWYLTDCAIAERSFHWPDCTANKDGDTT